MTFALVYARASADPKDQKISVDRQVKLCTARAAQLWPGAQVKVFRDDAITAADPTVQRPGFAAFLTAVRSARKGELTGIVVNEQSRLTRQGTGAWDELVVTLTKAGVSKVETLRSGPISVEPGNRLVGRLLAVVDAEEIERTKSRVQAAHRELFAEGRPSGRPPFGYRLKEKKSKQDRSEWELDPVEAPVVEQIFEWALQGYAISAIVAKLNDDGIPPPSARWKFKDKRQLTKWRQITVRGLLAAPSYAKLRAHTGEDGVLQTVPATWPALIDADQWKAVQRLLDKPTTVVGVNGEAYRVRTRPKAKARKYLLSGGRRRGLDGPMSGELYGVLRCAKCGLPLVAQCQRRRDGRTVSAYACHVRISPDACSGVSVSPAGEVDAMVVEAIQRRLAASPGLRQRLNAVQDTEAGRWRAERDAAKGRMLTAAELFGAGTIDRDTFDAMHRPAKAAFDATEARLEAMTTDTVLPTADDVMHGWDKLTLTVQRAVVERLIAKIVVSPGIGLARVGEPEWLAPL